MTRFALAGLVAGLSAAAAHAQFIRVPAGAFRPAVAAPRVFHTPGVHGGSSDSSGSSGDDDTGWIIGGVGLSILLILAGIGWYRKARRPTEGIRIRVVSVPAGEAPLDVRLAWVGVEFPALNRTPVVVNGRGVLTAALASAEWGYIVDASVAVTALAATNPLAAAWWRTNVPGVSVAGAQLIFRDTECTLLG